MDFKILIIIAIIAFRIFIARAKSQAEKNIVEADNEELKPIETEDEIPEIFKKIFQTEEKKGNVREGSNLPPPMPNMPIITEITPSPEINSYGDDVVYNNYSNDLADKKVDEEKAVKTNHTEEKDRQKDFDLRKAIIYSEILSPKFKEY